MKFLMDLENGKIIITSCVYPTSGNELVNLNIFQLPYHKFSSRRLIEILNAVDFLISIINYDNLSQEDFIYIDKLWNIIN